MDDAPNPEAQAAAIRRAILTGNKIEAIKLFREQTKVGLAEAKAMVEKLEADLRRESPESFTAEPAKGCSMQMLAVAAFVAGLVAILSALRNLGGH